MGAKKGILQPNNLESEYNLIQNMPVGVMHSKHVWVSHLDGTKGARHLPLGTGGYDKVLLDAPSSDERSVVRAQAKAPPGQNSRELRNWDVSSSKNMAEVQVKLLMTALQAVRFGGRVVYSTRSISDEENDGVVETVIALIEEKAKKGDLLWTAEVEQLDGEVERRLVADWAEKTGKGWAVLPDHPGGGKWGPLYFSVLTKKSST